TLHARRRSHREAPQVRRRNGANRFNGSPRDGRTTMTTASVASKAAGRATARRCCLIGAGAALAAFALTAAASLNSATAQHGFPYRTIRMMVGFPPGGGIDVVARLFAHKMSQMLQQTVVVENRPGAAGSIAASQIASANPDGYAILAGSNSIIINRIINPKSSLDVERDLHVISLIARQPMIAISNADSSIDSLATLVATARTRPV